MSVLCPTCGRRMPRARNVTFDSEFGLVRFGDGVAKLTPMQGPIFSALHAAWPKAVTSDHLYSVLYSLRGEWDQPGPEIIRVQISKMRRRLEKVGLRIEHGWYGGHLYRLVIPSIKERTA